MTVRASRFLAPLLALAILAPLSAGAGHNRADGTLTGKILNEDGTPAAKVSVRILHAPERRKAGEAPGNTGPANREPVAKADTDEHGAFTVSLPAGEYIVQVGKRGEAVGRTRVTIDDGKTATVEVKLKKAEAGGEKPRKPRNNR